MPLWAAEPPSREAAEPPPSLQVRFIRFSGVKSFREAELKEILDTSEKGRLGWLRSAPLDENVLDEDVRRVEKFYLSRGFYHARVASRRVTPLEGRDVRIDIEVEEGPPMMVRRVLLEVNGRTEGPWCEEIYPQLPLQPSMRFTTRKYRDCEKSVLGYLAQWGYPKGKVDLRARLSKDANEGEVFVKVETGPICFFGPVTVEGSKKVREEVVLREVTFQPGERFDGLKVRESQRNLLDLQLFQFVDLDVRGLETDAVDLPVRILLKEGKKQTIRAGAGYGTEEEFRGRVEWEMRNFLGDGRRLRVNARASFIEQIVESDFLQPYFPWESSSMTVGGGFRHESQRSYENEKFYIVSRLNYALRDDLTLYAGHNLESNRLVDVDLEDDEFPVVDRENEQYYVSSLMQGLSWIRVDDPLDPRDGLQFFQNLEWATVGLGSEVDYVKLTLEGRKYFPLDKWGVLALRAKWGGIRQLENTDAVPIFKRFFSGGSNSVRGYPYQRLGDAVDQEGEPVGGLTLLEGNVDWRFPLPFPRSLEGVLFFDFGNVFEDSFHLLWDNLRYTVGCGIRYPTRVGPLRLDVGYQINPPDLPDEASFNRYQIHFSIGQAF